MKKFLSLLLVLVLAFSLVGCGKKEDKKPEQPADGKTTEQKQEDQKDAQKKDAKDLHIGFVTDIGGIDDKSYNQTTWEGVKKFAADFGLEDSQITFLQSKTEADYIPNLSSLADQKMDLIVAAGYKFQKALTDIADNYPDQKFLIIDSVVEKPNVASAIFSENEGSFLVGVAAGLKTKAEGKNKVGFIGGEDSELIQRFEAGYVQGVKAVDPNIEVVIEYAASFADPAKGQTIASKLYDSGCYVIYHAAGGTGNGVIKEAKDRKLNGQDVWAIGVDTDQYDEGIYEGDKSVILTSMLKGVGVASHDVCKMVMDGTFKGELLVFDLSNDGVDIPANNPNLEKEWVDEIQKFKEKVKSGEIKVDPVPERIKKN